MSQFLMPSLGADMEAGTLVEWLKHPGDTLARGDIIAVIETQKGAIEIEVFQDGTLEKTLVEPGTEVPVGTPLAMIRAPGEAAEPEAEPAPAAAPKPEAEPAPAAAPKPEPAPKPAPPPRAEPAAAPKPQPAPQPAPQPPAAPASARRRVTPAARRFAAEKGIDPERIARAEGAVTLSDVIAGAGGASAARAPAKAPTEKTPAEKAPTAEAAPGEPISEMRAAIAAAMSRSKHEIPHYYLSHTIDVTAAEDFVARRNEGRPPEDRLIVSAVWTKAVALALRKFPELNGHMAGEHFRQSEAIHTGIAINLRGGGLVAPALHNADERSLDDLMAGLRDLVSRVRAGRFRGSELSDPTITITSLGDRGVDRLYGVIYPPQVAIVGIGTPATRPWVIDGAVAPRRTVTLTLAADHRVSDGHRGALFLTRIGALLSQPEKL